MTHLTSSSPTPTVLSAAIRHAATSSAPACILDCRGAYLFANEAWSELEAERGAPRSESLVGARFIDHVEGADVRRAWSEALDEMLSGTGCSRSVASEHNTPTLARLASTRIFPIAAAHGVLGLVLVRTIVRERPISELYSVSMRTVDAYRCVDGAVTQCPCCRRVRDSREPAAWEVLPRWIAAPPPGVQWVTCDLCAELHLRLARDAA